MSTLAQLKASVDAWLARDDVGVTNVDFPQILQIAESEISRDFRFAVQEASANLVFTGQSVDLPDDFLEARNPFIDSTTRVINYMTPKVLRESIYFQSGQPGGQFYTIEGQNAAPLTAGATNLQMTIAGPGTPTEPVTIGINYWARFPALVLDPDTNWILQNHYDIYLYATLRVACEYIQEDILEDRYQQKYDRCVEMQNRHENRKRYTAAPKQAYGNPRTVV